jgi:peptidoglycan/xylan/chitin deacetylase (PgdA/CDA1 family)
MRKRHCSNITMAGLVVLMMLGLYLRASLDGADVKTTYISDNVATQGSSTADRVSTAGKAGASDPPEKKKIALTFDDGPNPEYTMMLLSGLKERGVKATFFLLGKEVEKYPDIVAEIYADGHLIGTHSYEHVNLGNLSDAEAVAQVDMTNAAISDVTGESTEFIRPPFGSWKANLDYETKMIEVLWDIDPLDWKTDNSDVIAMRVTEKVQENDIILLHDASESSVNAAFKIIDALTAEGYVFVTVDEIILE